MGGVGIAVLIFVSAFAFLFSEMFNLQIDRSMQKVKKNEISFLKEKIQEEINKNFYNERLAEDLKKEKIQEVCSSLNLICKDLFWKVYEVPENYYDYLRVEVYKKERDNKPLFVVSNKEKWEEYIKKVRNELDIICKGITDYYRDKLRETNIALNWYAKNGRNCSYDNNRDGVKIGETEYRKEILCSEGWLPLSPENGNFGQFIGERKLLTGTVEYDNTNRIYRFPFPCAGKKDIFGNPLTGMSPPYGVALRVKIDKRHYIQMCCGF